MDIRNPSHNALGGIDCEIKHPQFGWIPHTIEPGSELEALARKRGDIAAYVPPPPMPDPEHVEPPPTPAQLQAAIEAVAKAAGLSDKALDTAMESAGITRTAEVTSKGLE